MFSEGILIYFYTDRFGSVKLAPSESSISEVRSVMLLRHMATEYCCAKIIMLKAFLSAVNAV